MIERRGEPMPKQNKHVVFSIHGIRTGGKWQKELSRLLSENDFAYEPLDFGWFSALNLIMPYCSAIAQEFRIPAGRKITPVLPIAPILN